MAELELLDAFVGDWTVEARLPNLGAGGPAREHALRVDARPSVPGPDVGRA